MSEKILIFTIVSVVYHGGSKVVCYPYDNVHSAVPDIQFFKYMSQQYVKTNKAMSNGYPCPKEWPKEKFPGGFLAGADWYPFEGGMQDMNYNFSNAFEITVEVSCKKVPYANELPPHWQENRESLVSFVKMVSSHNVRSQISGTFIIRTLSWLKQFT